MAAPEQGGGRGLEATAHSRWLEVKGPQGHGEPKEDLFHVLRSLSSFQNIAQCADDGYNAGMPIKTALLD